MDFPRYVFRSPGNEKLSTGGTFASVIVENQDEYDEAVSLGYSDMVLEAIANPGNVEKVRKNAEEAEKDRLAAEAAASAPDRERRELLEKAVVLKLGRLEDLNKLSLEDLREKVTKAKV